MEENIGNNPQTILRWSGYKSQDYHKFEQKRTRGDPFAHKLEQSGGGGGGGGGALVFSGILVNIFENLLGRGLMKILLRVKILVITSVF